jgi:NAD(P)-dependent dehydrogenase (short-subunit alcohol dehydrogenase family)
MEIESGADADRIGSALIVGGSSDIGSAIARRLAARGGAVAVHYNRRHEEAAAVAAEIQAGGGKAKAYGADVRDLGAVADLIKLVEVELGAVEVLVYAAADVRFSRFLDSDPATWRPQLEATLLGFMNCAQPVAKTMAAAGWGRIVVIAAEGGRVAEPALAVASAAKAGLIGFSRSLARELAPSGVTVNVVSPGFIPTSSTPPHLRSPERLAAITRAYPAARLGTTADVAATVAFLCSAEAGYVTGQVISVAGGYGIP